MRDSMVIYKSFYEAVKDLDNDTKVRIYDAIYEYGLYLNEPNDLDGISKVVWTLIKPQLDANLKKYKNGQKGAKHGAKGGRPKKPSGVNNKNPLGVIDKNPIPLKSKTPNVNVNDNVNENENVLKGKNKNKNFDFNQDKLMGIHKELINTHKLDAKKLLRNDGEMYKTFLKWIVYMDVDINVVSKVEMNLKKFTNEIKKLYTTDSIIAAVEHAMLENHKSFFPKEKLPNHENRERLSDFLKK